MSKWVTVKIKQSAHRQLAHEAIERSMRLQDLVDKILKDWFWERKNNPLPDKPWDEGK